MKILSLLLTTAFISSFAVGADLGLSTQSSGVRASTRRFNSAQEMSEDGSKLLKMTTEKRYQEILNLPVVPLGNCSYTLTLDDGEYYRFCFIYSNATSYTQLAHDDGLSAGEKHEKYKTALRLIDEYKSQFDNSVSCIERVDLRMKKNKMQLDALAAEVWGRIERIYVLDLSKKQLVEDANLKSISNYNNFISNCNIVQKYVFPPLSEKQKSDAAAVEKRNKAIKQRLDMLADIKLNLPNAYFSLLGEYATASRIFPQKAPKYIQNINKIRSILEKLGRLDLYEAGTKTLEILEKRQEADRIVETAAISSDKRLNLDREAHLASIGRDLLSSLEKISSLAGISITNEQEVFREHTRVVNEMKQRGIDILRAQSSTLSELQESFEPYRKSIIGIERY